MWSVLTASVRGASHIRHDLPNQDAVAFWREPERGLPFIIALSDGHGSSRCFRSDRGSRLAVEAAVNVIREFATSQAGSDNCTAIKRIADELLPRKIVRQWRDAVAADMAADPLPGRIADQDNDGPDDAIIYGATLISVLVTESFIIYWQIGDGDILTVSEDGDVEWPVPGDDRLFANETTSLCGKEAWRDFRFRFQKIIGKAPRLILCATDGYANSFRNSGSFRQVGADIWQMIRNGEAGRVENSLESWLNEASADGSGDDISVGLIFQNISNHEPGTMPEMGCPV